MIQLLAVDLDDTLLTEDLKILSQDAAALRRAMESGVHVILASGRTFFSMEPYAIELGMMGRDGYMICNNGSSVIDTRTGEEIYSKRVPPEAARAVWEIVKEYNLTMQYYGHGIIYSSGTNAYTDRDCLLTGQRMELIPDFASALDTGRMKFVIPGDPDLLADVERAIVEVLGTACNVLISKPYFLEILPGDADKSTALEFTASSLGIDSCDVMAMGDSMNDLRMIRWAGTGIAMKNGIEAVRRAADAVTPVDHNQAAVAWAVDRYIFSGSETLRTAGGCSI